MAAGVNTKPAGRPGTLAGRLGKRALDLALASGGLVVTAPILAALALAVRRDMGSPVLFSQVRPGRDGRPFRMWKFRTMRDARDGAGRPLPDGERLTALGRWLRASSLDELPELWNVVRGEMSLVGPRPLLVDYLDFYDARQARRHDVRPGITGWAQINGRNAIDWGTKLELDVWYVEHQTLRLDVAILVRTITAVVRRDGIRHAGSETMPRFTGTRPGDGTP